jgi:hypothetical protein
MFVDRPRCSSACLALLVSVLGCGQADQPVTSKPPATNSCGPFDSADARSIARGACAVIKRGCDTCHQSSDPDLGTMSGQTTPRLGTMSYPANLTPDLETGLGLWTNDEIVRAIRVGLDDNDQPLCFIMARFDRMGDDEAYAIAHYLKSLPPVNHPIPASVCPPVKPREDAGADASDAGDAGDSGDADSMEGAGGGA